jgi:hypothetical protein
MARLGQQIKLLNLLNEILNEIGDLQNIESYEFDYNPWESSFYTEDGDLVIMRVENDTEILRNDLEASKIFEKEKNEIYNISFEVNGTITQAKKTSLKELIKILKTVSIFAAEEIKRIDSNLPKDEKPIFVVGAQSKSEIIAMNDPQKFMLYTKIISNLLPSNYRKQDGKFENIPIILIQRVK